MHKNPIGPCLRWALVSICLCTISDSTSAGAFTHGCAARDLQILMLIEDRESSGMLSMETSNDALLAMLEARVVCHEGHVVDAMALYDSIARSITPDAILSARQR
jgi:hypothetical protein